MLPETLARKAARARDILSRSANPAWRAAAAELAATPTMLRNWESASDADFDRLEWMVDNELDGEGIAPSTVHFMCAEGFAAVRLWRVWR